MDKFRLIEYILMIATIVMLVWFAQIAFEAKRVCEGLENVRRNTSKPEINLTQIFPED